MKRSDLGWPGTIVLILGAVVLLPEVAALDW